MNFNQIKYIFNYQKNDEYSNEMIDIKEDEIHYDPIYEILSIPAVYYYCFIIIVILNRINIKVNMR